MDFVVGQRWASHGEKSLGLGVVTQVDFRRVTINFPAAGEIRTYAADNAPLSRIRYRENDVVEDMDAGRYTVQSLEERDGLITYHCLDSEGAPKDLQELELNCFVQISTPLQRLANGHFSRLGAYRLRLDTLDHWQRLRQSAVDGLLGARVRLLAHQIHIAAEVASRHQPRVLLADEVGLGKTIEAGLILHHQIHCAQAARILILVPENLLHQWLVEMLRRFNLRFSIFDRARIEALLASAEDSPFESEQQILCSLDEICADPRFEELLLTAPWDLLVVDEAHHLHWTAHGSSREYDLVEQLARRTASVLLLTATPGQAGIDSHFARLRLLDPARFHDLEAFKREQDGFAAVNALVRALQDCPGPLPADCQDRLAVLLGEDAAAGNDREAQIRALLDRHGTGRVLFRNTRAAVSGFPRRRVHVRGLPAPDCYAGIEPGAAGWFPEQAVEESRWLQDDPRVAWLQALIKAQRPGKILVICHLAATAVALEKHFNLRAGIRCAAFHEGLSIIERDRAAAWFAEADNGAQVLLCSEIGSEGRNFQFSRHLVLFDLPLDPDLIEQRIGRLDRIGQGEAIDIHVPCLQDSPQQVLLRWYHEGLDIFAQSCPAGHALHEQYHERLGRHLRGDGGGDALEALIEATRRSSDRIRHDLEQGRDRLLELNSCDPARARRLIEEIESEEQGLQLGEYMRAVFDHYGVDCEDHSEQTLILRPGGHMRTDHFPGLRADGISVTWDRARALVREDLEFLSWEHPMVAEIMEMVLKSDTGNAAVATLQLQALKPGSLLLETCFSIDCVAPAHLQLQRYLPLHPTRLLLDAGGNDYTRIIPRATLDKLCEPLAPKLARTLVARVLGTVERLLATAQTRVQAELPRILQQARHCLQRQLAAERQRLTALRQVNPGIREAEIKHLVQKQADCERHIDRAEFQLQALRLIVSR